MAHTAGPAVSSRSPREALSLMVNIFTRYIYVKYRFFGMMTTAYGYGYTQEPVARFPLFAVPNFFSYIGLVQKHQTPKELAVSE
jgi:hypothetical protein